MNIFSLVSIITNNKDLQWTVNDIVVLTILIIRVEIMQLKIEAIVI